LSFEIGSDEVPHGSSTATTIPSQSIHDHRRRRENRMDKDIQRVADGSRVWARPERELARTRTPFRCRIPTEVAGNLILALHWPRDTPAIGRVDYDGRTPIGDARRHPREHGRDQKQLPQSDPWLALFTQIAPLVAPCSVWTRDVAAASRVGWEETRIGQ